MRKTISCLCEGRSSRIVLILIGISDIRRDIALASAGLDIIGVPKRGVIASGIRV